MSKVKVMSDIVNSLAAFHDEGYQIAFTWCQCYRGVVLNEMADEHARKGTAVNQESVRHHYDSAKDNLRRVSSGGKTYHERIRWVCVAKGEKLDSTEKLKSVWERADVDRSTEK